MNRSFPCALLVCAALSSGCYMSYGRMHRDASEDHGLDFNIDPGTDAWEECHDRVFDVSQGRPDVLILMDRSESMRDGGFWTPAQRAVEEILSRWDDQIAFGLAVFPSRLCVNSSSFMCVPTTGVDVVPMPAARDAVGEALVGACCCGGTPLAESLEFAERYYRSLGDGRAHHLLLVTDGAPNCNPLLDQHTCTCSYGSGDSCASEDTSLNCLDDLRAVAAASNLSASSVPVHVLGLADAAINWSWVMDDIAEAGGTDRAVLAEETGLIEEAIDAIAGDVAPCRFEFSPGEVADPGMLHFIVDGVEIPRDPTHADGWDFVNAWTVDFFGPACERIVAGEVGIVTARVNCA